MASKRRVGRRPRPQFRPNNAHGRGHQGHRPGTRFMGEGRHGEPLWAVEPEGSVRVTRVPFTPRPDLADKDRDAMWVLIRQYGNRISYAGRYAGRAYERDGVIYLPLDQLLHQFASRLAEWGRFAPKPIEVEVPESHA